MYEAHLNERKKDFDWLLLLATVALAVTGVLFIFSATEEAAQGQPLYRQPFFLQIVWIAVGLVAAAAVCLVDYGKLARWSRVVYWAAIASLAAVLVIGKVVHGGQRWISLGFARMQPSEFAKIAFIFLLADFLSRPVEELRQPKVFFAALGYTALPFRADFERAGHRVQRWFFFPSSLVMMFVAGVPNRFLGRLVGGASLVVVLVVAAVLLSPSHLERSSTPYQQKNMRCFLRDVKKRSDYNVRAGAHLGRFGRMAGKGLAAGDAA